MLSIIFKQFNYSYIIMNISMFSHYLSFLFHSFKIYKDFYLVKLLTICHCEYRLWIEKFSFAAWKLLNVKKENAIN